MKTLLSVLQNKTPIRIKDVATVAIGPGFRRGALDKNGIEAVGGVVTMRFGENPREVIARVKERIKSIEKGLPNQVVLKSFYDRSEIIEKTYSTVTTALTQEVIITIAVIMLFLLHFNSSVLVSITLPFGIGISFLLMYVLDIDSNIMSLSGMVIAIGSMVDMGIVMTENIYARLSKKPNSCFKGTSQRNHKCCTRGWPSYFCCSNDDNNYFSSCFWLRRFGRKTLWPTGLGQRHWLCWVR